MVLVLIYVHSWSVNDTYFIVVMHAWLWLRPPGALVALFCRRLRPAESSGPFVLPKRCAWLRPKRRAWLRLHLPKRPWREL